VGRHLIALTVTLGFMEAYYRLGLPPGPEPGPFVIALFLATAKGHRTLAVCAAVAAAVMVTAPEWEFEDLPQVLPALAVVIAAGEIARIRRAYLSQSRQRAVDAERLRISRELHDVLVHHMSVINVQAGAALLRPAHATEALGVIKQASRDALDEVRSTIGVLRAPGIRQLDDLVERVCTDGLTVRKRIRGDTELPPDVDHVAYRIVQEALTNVVRHAEATRVTVQLDHRPGEVTVAVSDNGKGSTSPLGNGLSGMRERVTALGGELVTSSEPGFRVAARIPL
jgi:signal transduction histidine kinase